MKSPRSCWNGSCILLLMLCFALSGTSVAQNQYYIAPTGSDSNDGSKAHPWATINHADSALTLGPAGTCVSGTGWETAKGVATTGIGACVHVANGTYSSGAFTTASGTASARIRYITDTQYGAKLNGAGSSMWANYGQYIDVVGFEFDGTGVNVQNGYINYYDSIHFGCHTQLLNNKAHDIWDAGGAIQGPGAIGTGGNDVNTGSRPDCGNLYQGNLIYHNNGGGSNTFLSGSGNGAINMAAGDIAQDNIVMDQGGTNCIGPTHTSIRVIVTNNTILNCAGSGIQLWRDPRSGPVNDFTTVTNNIIVNTGRANSSGGISIYSPSGSGTGGCGTHNIYANNLMYGNTGGNWTGNCPNTSTGTQTGSNSTTFVSYTGTVSGDYHLKAGSNGIALGTRSCALTGCVPALDFAGNARLQASDIGSYAFAVTGAPTAPTGLTASVQ